MAHVCGLSTFSRVDFKTTIVIASTKPEGKCVVFRPAVDLWFKFKKERFPDFPVKQIRGLRTLCTICGYVFMLDITFILFTSSFLTLRIQFLV